MDSVFNQLNGKQGNQIKLMSVLLGTAGDGSFAVSEKWICDRTGMDQSNYSRARKALIDRGWLRLENGKLYVNFIAFYKPADHSADMSSEQGTCDDNMIETCDNSMHNKEKTNNKINKYLSRNNNYNEEYCEDDHQDEPFGLNSILEGMFVVEKVESSHIDYIDETSVPEYHDEYMDWYDEDSL